MIHVEEFKQFKDYINLYESGKEEFKNPDSVLYEIVAEKDKYFQTGIIDSDGQRILGDRTNHIDIGLTGGRCIITSRTKWGTSTNVYHSQDYSLMFIPKSEDILQIYLVHNNNRMNLNICNK